ncbi:MAG: glycosyltransferase family 2 protein [Actinomycetota bacterium]|nr:glycosyltransferase family 2 protein [Actinomycetota bacterium]
MTHDGRRWLDDCLRSLDRQSYSVMDVVVVDDSSPPGPSEEPLHRVAGATLGRRRHTVMRTPSPFGFGGAVNWALDRLRPDAELLLFIHDDVALDPDSVEHMVRRMSLDPGTAVVGPKVVAWDEPALLEEVGWSTDRFGHSYHGLEEGERDSGQRDLAREVFHVTSTCMLVRRSVFYRLNGWDTKMRAFCEDLDLCWRARLAGYSVEVDPAARVLHAAALTHHSRQIVWGPTRYLVRRNRLRAVAKNSSALRLLWLVPQLFLLAFAEMAGYLVIRQPRAAFQVLGALGWNLAVLPSTLPARWRSQRIRKIPDGNLRRFTVPATIRMRSYIARRSDRLEAVWGHHTKALLAGTRAPMRVRSRVIPVVALIGMLLVLGLRDSLLTPSVSVGELLPFPEGATTMFQAYAQRWSGLEQAGAAPPALLILGVFPVLTLGAAALAQKLLVACLILGAAVGAYRLTAAWAAEGRAGRLGAYAAALAYTVGPVGYTGMRAGRLGALVFGAAAPYVVSALARLCGPPLPPRNGRERVFTVRGEVGRIALGCGVSAAFVPASLMLYAGVAVLAGLSGALVGEGRGRGRVVSLAAACGGIAAGWALLLPWSASWLDSGGALFRLLESPSSPTYSAAFSNESAASVLLAKLPAGFPPMGPTLVLAGVAALAMTRAPQRRFALFLWACLGAIGLTVALWASGRAPPLVASPVEAGVLAALAWAALAGLAVGGALERLSRAGRQGVAAAALLSLLAALAVASVVPPLAAGAYAPGRAQREAVERERPGTMGPQGDIAAMLGPEMAAEGAGKVLWVGGDAGLRPSLLRSSGELRLTEAQGPLLSDIFPSGGPGPGVARAVASAEAGGTDRAGRELAPWDIRFIVVSTAGAAERDRLRAWLSQRDLGLVSDEPGYLLLTNAGMPPVLGRP